GANNPRLPRWVDIRGMGGSSAKCSTQCKTGVTPSSRNFQGSPTAFTRRGWTSRQAKVGSTSPWMWKRSSGYRIEGGASAKLLEGLSTGTNIFFTRYLVAMQQLEQGLGGGEALGPPIGHQGLLDTFAERGERFAAGDVGARELFGRDKTWLPPAGEATWKLVESAQSWAEFGRYIGDMLRPQPVMRLVPEV